MTVASARIGQPVGAAAAQNNAAAISSARGRYFLHNIVNYLLDTQFGGEWTSSEGTGYYANLQTALDQGSAAVSLYERWTPAYAQLQYSLFAANINMSANAGIKGYTHVKTTLSQTDDFGLDLKNLLQEVEIHSTVIGSGIKHGWVGRNESMWSGGELNSFAWTQLGLVVGEAAGPVLGTIKWVPKIAGRLSDYDLVKKAAILAEKAIGGTGRFAGTSKHVYATKLLQRYQKIYGSRGFEFGHYFNNGVGNRGFLDVINRSTNIIYDFKFGSATMSNSQFLKYSRNFEGFLIEIIRP